MSAHQSTALSFLQHSNLQIFPFNIKLPEGSKSAVKMEELQKRDCSYNIKINIKTVFAAAPATCSLLFHSMC